jgi:hypothetical protein
MYEVFLGWISSTAKDKNSEAKENESKTIVVFKELF